MTTGLYTYDPVTGTFYDENGVAVFNPKMKVRILIRRETRSLVEADGATNGKRRWAGELFYATDEGHLYVGDGTGQRKCDVRGLQHMDGILQTYEGQIQLY